MKLRNLTWWTIIARHLRGRFRLGLTSTLIARLIASLSPLLRKGGTESLLLSHFVEFLCRKMALGRWCCEKQVALCASHNMAVVAYGTSARLYSPCPTFCRQKCIAATVHQSHV